MNIYEKLQEARIKFLASNVKKSGFNKFTKFNYFELSDIVPVLNPIMKELKMTSVTKFDDAMACMSIINSEKPEEVIEFTTPLAAATMKGSTPIQELGSQHTYIRRYLYLLAFDIIESDGLDANIGNPDNAKNIDDYKKDIDKAKSKDDLTKIKNEVNASKLDKTQKAELIDFCMIKFQEMTSGQ